MHLSNLDLHYLFECISFGGVGLYILLLSQAPLTFDSHYIYSWQVVALTALWEVSHLQLWAGAQCAAGLPEYLHHWLSCPGS